MGREAQAFFDEANQLGGLLAKIRLAALAQVTSTEAVAMEDRPEVIGRLRAAMDRLKSEFATPGEAQKPSVPAVAAAATGGLEARTLRRHLQTFLDLMTQRATLLGDVPETVRRVTEAASSALGCARVSVWWLAKDKSKITCANLFEREGAKHSTGGELLAKDFSPYFVALESERTIAAHDAHRDPRTRCFSKSYLGPLGINSMLDVPIWAKRRMVGVVCHEHVGPARTWDSDEETFAYLMSSFVALSIERGTP